MLLITSALPAQVRAGPLADWEAMETPMDGHPEALVDLSAVRDNVAALARHVRGAAVMAVVKSDAYGHGQLPVATARGRTLGVVTSGLARAFSIRLSVRERFGLWSTAE